MNNKEINELVKKYFIEEGNYPLLFNRVPFINVENEDEIVSNYSGELYAADIIADQDTSHTFELSNISFSQNLIPRIRFVANPKDFSSTEDLVRNLVSGIKKRVCYYNTMMLIEQPPSKNMEVIWGMPSDLKFTFSYGDFAKFVKNACSLAEDNCREKYDTVIMNSSTFKEVSGYSETQSFVKAYSAMRNKLGMILEIWDETYSTEKVRKKILPDGKVLLLDSRDFKDKNCTSFDFANAKIKVSKENSSSDTEEYGPVFYMENFPMGNGGELLENKMLAVVEIRGFPRKHRKTSSAVITIKKEKYD